MSMPALSQHSLSVPRSGIRDVFDRVEHVPDAISLCVGEPSATAAPHIVEAACRSIREGHTTYTNVLGIEPVREAVAAYSEKVKGLRYDVDTEIQAVDGATIGLFLAMKALLDAGDEVILPSPYFTSYDAEALMCGGVPVPVALKPEHQMRLNADDIEAAITPRTKAVLLNSPGNPSGAVTPLSELERIADVCIRHDIWAISDEVYHPFVFDGSASIAPSIAAVDGMHERTVVVESLSKTFAMTGWRMGYVCAPQPVIAAMTKLHQFGIMSAPTTSQYAAIEAMRSGDEDIAHMREEYDSRRRYLVENLNRIGLDCFEPKGAFYVFPCIRSSGLSSDEFCERFLREEKVAVIPGTAFGPGGEGYVRACYASSMRDLTESISRLDNFLQNLRRKQGQDG